MNIPKKVIGWIFFISGFSGGFFGAWLQLFYPKIQLYYWIIYMGLIGSWFALFDYVKKLEGKKACR